MISKFSDDYRFLFSEHQEIPPPPTVIYICGSLKLLSSATNRLGTLVAVESGQLFNYTIFRNF